jgi:hypothetical protein
VVVGDEQRGFDEKAEVAEPSDPVTVVPSTVHAAAVGRASTVAEVCVDGRMGRGQSTRTVAASAIR